MSWLISSDNHRKALAEIEQTKSDRATAIVAAAVVESDLVNAIEARLKQDKDVVHLLFKPSGPLGAMEPKVQLGYLLGIYDKQVRDDLKRIVEIRNRFAHHMEPWKFNSRDIKKLCNNIKIVDAEEYPRVPGKGLPEENRSPPRLPDNCGPRDRFIQACKLLLIVFWAASHDAIIKNPETHKWRNTETP